MDLIHRVVPDIRGAVAAVELRDVPDHEALLPEEAAAVAAAGAKRRRDYAGGRQCARQAMSRLGIEPVAIRNGPDRGPVWPAGIVGSITHTESYYAAVVARDTARAGLGIDAEPDLPLSDAVLARVTSAEERVHLARLPGHGPAWDRVLFTLKEATYKACRPLTGQWLGFADASVTIDPDAGTARVVLHAAGPVRRGVELRELEATWAHREGVVASAVMVPSQY